MLGNKNGPRQRPVPVRRESLRHLTATISELESATHQPQPQPSPLTSPPRSISLLIDPEITKNSIATESQLHTEQHPSSSLQQHQQQKSLLELLSDSDSEDEEEEPREMPPHTLLTGPVDGDTFIHAVIISIKAFQPPKQPTTTPALSTSPSSAPIKPPPTAAPSSFGIASAASAISSTVFGSSTTGHKGRYPLSLPSGTFTIDPIHLAYLQYRFNESMVIQAYLSGDERSLTDAIAESKLADTKSTQQQTSTQSGSYLGMIWGSSATSAKDQTISIEEELLMIYQFMEKLTSIKIHSTQPPTCHIIESNPDLVVNLTLFKSLTALELFKLPVSKVDGWASVAGRIQKLVLNESIENSDAEDLLSLYTTISLDGSPRRPRTPTMPKQSRFAALTHLGLAFNSLTSIHDQLPSTFPSIAYLDISNNAFKSLPHSLSSFLTIEYLNIGDNKLEDLYTLSANSRKPLSLPLLKTLLCRKNRIEILSGAEGFPNLESIDLGENNISEVFEVGRLAQLDKLSSLDIDGNSISKIDNHRTNIFTYFKSHALNLALDGQIPTPTEKKTIMAGLTIAAVVTSGNPTKVTVPKVTSKARTKPLASASATPTGASESAAGEATLHVEEDGVVMKKDPSVSGKKKVKKKVVKKKQSSELMDDADKPEGVLVKNASKESLSVSDDMLHTTVETPPPELKELVVEIKAALEPEGALLNTLDLDATAHDTAIEPEKIVEPEVLESVPNRDENHELAVPNPAEAVTRTKEELILEDILPGHSELLPPPADAIAPPKKFIHITVKVQNTPSAEPKAISSSTTEPANTNDKQEQTTSSQERPDAGATGFRAAAHNSEPVTGTSQVSTPPRPQPASESPAFPKFKSFGPGFDLDDIKRDNAESWMTKLKELQAKERKASAAAQAAGAAALAASEAAKAAKEAAALAARGGDDFGAGAEANLMRNRDAFDVAVATSGNESSSIGLRNMLSKSSVPNIANAAAPIVESYRRVYTFETRRNSDQDPSHENASRGVSVSFRQMNGAKAIRKQTVSFGEVESGGVGDSPNLSTRVPKSTDLPLLSVGSKPETRGRALTHPVKGGPVVSLSLSSLATVSQADTAKSPESQTPEDANNIVSTVSPKLILSKPVAPSTVTYRRTTGTSTSGSGSKSSILSDSGRTEQTLMRSVGYYRPATLATPSSLVGRAMSLFGGETRSVFSGLTSARSISALFAVTNSNTVTTSETSIFPSFPTLPFPILTNSLKLFLKFNVFPKDSERILSWMPGSFVPQLPSSFSDLQTQIVNNLAKVQPGLAAQPLLLFNAPKIKPLVIQLMAPQQQTGYCLLTDQALYLFRPRYSMPYNPFVDDTAASPAGAAGYLSSIAAQVQYEDPSKLLKTWRRIPLTSVLRIDVGPNRQYITVHYVDEDVVQNRLRGKNRSMSVSGRVGYSAGLRLTQSASPPAKVTDSVLIKSVNIMIRDKSVTNEFLDTLLPLLFDGHGSAENLQVPNRTRIMNQDIEWSLKGLQESVLVRQNNSVGVVWNSPTVTNLDWRREVFGDPNALDNVGSSIYSTITRALSGVDILDKISTYSGVGPARRQSQSGSSNSGTPVPQQNDASQTVARTSSIIQESDNDRAVEEGLTKVDFEFLRLYLLVGWVAPLMDVATNELSSVTVQSLTLAATVDYIYLASERLDVWPPPLFPSESDQDSSVNSNVLAKIRSLSTSIAPESNPASVEDPLKGLTSDIVSHWSPALRVGRVKDLVRCERWRTWRWCGPNQRQPSQMESAKVAEREAAALIQNGCIGTIVRKDVGKWQCLDVEAPPKAQAKGDGADGPPRRDQAKVIVNSDGNVSGTASGWAWWVRVVFAAQKPSSASTSTSTSEVDSSNEYWWDLVFASLNSANEFLEFVMEVRGVRSEEEDAGDFVEDNFGNGDDRSGDAKFSPGLGGRRSENGVVFVIGDDS